MSTKPPHGQTSDGRPSPAGMESMSRRQMLKGLAFAIGASISYALVNVLTRQNVDKLGSPLAGVVLTVSFGMVVMSFMSAGKIKQNLKAERSGIVAFAIAGIFANIGVTCVFFALKSSPVVVVSPIISINPLISLILAHFFLKRLERITPRIYIGAFLVVAGVTLVSVAHVLAKT